MSDKFLMGMLDRYKKKGGFVQLLQLIETSPSKKQEQFLGLIAEESPAWEDTLRKKILTIDKVYSWDAQFLVEIFSRLQPLTLANALKGNPEDQVSILLSCLPPISKRKIQDLMAESNPSPAEKATCMMKIVTEVRGFAAQGIIKIDKIDPELSIPENIEELLSTSIISAMITESDRRKAEAPANVMIGGAAEESAPVASGANSQDVEFLKRKANQLLSEVNALKHENAVLKDKLAQIKRIA
jgi:hypothetical protein